MCLNFSIQNIALDFLIHGTPDTEKLFASNTFSDLDMAELFAIELLSHTASARLDALTPEQWGKWAPLIVAGYCDNTDWQAGMQKMVFQHAPHEVLQAVLNQVDKRNRDGLGLTSLHEFDDFWSPALLGGLLARLDSLEYKPRSRLTILEYLLKRSEPAGCQRARALLAQVADVEMRRHAAALLLLWDTRKSWPVIWQLLEDDPAFAKGFMGEVAHDLRWPGPGSPRLELDENQTADLYAWLEIHFPARQDPVHHDVYSPTTIDHVADFRRLLLDSLKQAGTWAAVSALERIGSRLPDGIELKWACQQARSRAMDKQWQPPSWQELAQLLANPDSRLIHTGEDLALVVLESLARLQDKLRGETPLAPFLWDETSRKHETSREPKGEGRLSDFLKNYLSDNLNRQGVLINREVEIKNWPGKGRGKTLDLLIQAATPNGVASVVVEVKGCWNSGLDTAMETQLRDQYLATTAHRHGIYLVGWYGTQGEGGGRRRELDSLRRQLEKQARQLSTDTLRIRALTLDLSFPG